MAQTATKPRDENHAEASGCGSHGTFCWNELMTRDVERAKKKAEELVAEGIKTVEAIIANKEKDILEV